MSGIPHSQAAVIESFRRAYWTNACIAAACAFVLWFLWRGDWSSWWAIDGYPTLIAARLWIAGKEQFIYHPELWLTAFGNAEWKRQLVELKIISGGTSFVYHPLYLWVLAPLVAWADYDSFIILWNLVCAIATGIVIVESMLIARVPLDRGPRLLLVVASCSFPAMYAASLGQNITVALALLLVGARFAREGHWLAGPMLTLSVSAKAWLLPLALLIPLLRLKDGWWKRGVAAYAVLGLGLVLLPWFLQPDFLRAYLAIAGKLSDVTILAYNNVSVRGLFSRYLHDYWFASSHRWAPVLVTHELKIIEAMLLGWLCLVAAFVALKRRSDASAIVLAGCCFVLLLPGVCWTHYYVLLVPPAIALASSSGALCKVAGWTMLVILCLPWHSFAHQSTKWPLSGDISMHPDLSMVLLALPPMMALVSGFLTLSCLRTGEAVQSEARSTQEDTCRFA